MVGADAVLENYGRLAHASRLPSAVWHHDRRRALRALNSGEFDKADALFHDLFVQSRRLRLPYGGAHYIMHSAALAHERTGLEAISISDWKAELEWASTIPTFHAHWVRLLLESGRRDEARRRFDAIAEGGFGHIVKDIGYLNALAHLSLVAVALEDRPRAETLYGLLLPYPNHNTPNGFNYQLGSVSFFLGVLARLLGRAKDAAAHFEEALAMNARMGCIPYVARTQAAFGDLLAGSARPADRLRADALLSEAAKTARRLEMAPFSAYVERCQGRLATATTGGAPSRSRTR
jgi:tetratricopeptide (TPR) repeat protein